MNRLVLFLLLVFIASACSTYRPACNTRAGKKKLQHYNSIQYQKATKWNKNKNGQKKRRVAWSY